MDKVNTDTRKRKNPKSNKSQSFSNSHAELRKRPPSIATYFCLVGVDITDTSIYNSVYSEERGGGYGSSTTDDPSLAFEDNEADISNSSYNITSNVKDSSKSTDSHSSSLPTIIDFFNKKPLMVKLLDRYPEKDYEDIAIGKESIPLFFPIGATIKITASHHNNNDVSGSTMHQSFPPSAPMPVFYPLSSMHSSVGGGKIEFYEEIPVEQLKALPLPRLIHIVQNEYAYRKFQIYLNALETPVNSAVAASASPNEKNILILNTYLKCWCDIHASVICMQTIEQKREGAFKIFDSYFAKSSRNLQAFKAQKGIVANDNNETIMANDNNEDDSEYKFNVQEILDAFATEEIIGGDPNHDGKDVSSLTITSEDAPENVESTAPHPSPNKIVDLLEGLYKNLLRELKLHVKGFINNEITELSFWVPRAIALLSRQPFYRVFENVLWRIFKIATERVLTPVPLERCIAHIVREVPEPPLGKKYVSFKLYQGDPFPNIVCSRPPSNRLPLVDFSMRGMFECLSLDNVIEVFFYALFEQKIVFMSENLVLVYNCTETLRALLFPLTWACEFCNILPDPILLESIHGYIYGIHTSMEPTDSFLLDEILLVDLDNDRLSKPSSSFVEVPDRIRNKLREKLRHHVYNDSDDRLPPLSSSLGAQEIPMNSPSLPNHKNSKAELSLLDMQESQLLLSDTIVPAGDSVLQTQKSNNVESEEQNPLPFSPNHKSGGIAPKLSIFSPTGGGTSAFFAPSIRGSKSGKKQLNTQSSATADPLQATSSYSSLTAPFTPTGQGSIFSIDAIILNIDAQKESQDKFNDTVREKVFLKLMIYLLQHYRGALGSFESDGTIDQNKFIEGHPDSKSYREFFKKIVESQMIANFLDSAVFSAENTFEIMLFDAMLDRKSNPKEKGFLDDTSQNHKETEPIPSPSARDFGNAGPFRCGTKGIFPYPLNWQSLGHLKIAEDLSRVDGTGLIDNISGRLESAYLTLYPSMRAFNARLRVMKEKAVSGLVEAKNLYQIIQKESEAILSFSKFLGRHVDKFPMVNETNAEMRRSIWPRLINWCTGLAQLLQNIATGLRNKVCDQISELVRQLENSKKILAETERARIADITKSKNDLEKAKKNKNKALKEAEQINEEYEKLLSFETGPVSSRQTMNNQADGSTNLSTFDSASVPGDDTSKEDPPNSPNLQASSGRQWKRSRRLSLIRKERGGGTVLSLFALNQPKLTQLANKKVYADKQVQSTSVHFDEQVADLDRELKRFTDSTEGIIKNYHDSERKRIESLQNIIKEANSIHATFVAEFEKITIIELLFPVNESAENSNKQEGVITQSLPNTASFTSTSSNDSEALASKLDAHRTLTNLESSLNHQQMQDEALYSIPSSSRKASSGSLIELGNKTNDTREEASSSKETNETEKLQLAEESLYKEKDTDAEEEEKRQDVKLNQDPDKSEQQQISSKLSESQSPDATIKISSVIPPSTTVLTSSVSTEKRSISQSNMISAIAYSSSLSSSSIRQDEDRFNEWMSRLKQSRKQFSEVSVFLNDFLKEYLTLSQGIANSVNEVAPQTKPKKPSTLQNALLHLNSSLIQVSSSLEGSTSVIKKILIDPLKSYADRLVMVNDRFTESRNENAKKYQLAQEDTRIARLALENKENERTSLTSHIAKLQDDIREEETLRASTNINQSNSEKQQQDDSGENMTSKASTDEDSNHKQQITKSSTQNQTMADNQSNADDESTLSTQKAGNTYATSQLNENIGASGYEENPSPENEFSTRNAKDASTRGNNRISLPKRLTSSHFSQGSSLYPGNIVKSLSKAVGGQMTTSEELEKCVQRLEGMSADIVKLQGGLDDATDAERKVFARYSDFLLHTFTLFEEEETKRVMLVRGNMHKFGLEESAILRKILELLDTMGKHISNINIEQDMKVHVSLELRAIEYTKNAMKPFGGSDAMVRLLFLRNAPSESTVSPAIESPITVFDEKKDLPNTLTKGTERVDDLASGNEDDSFLSPKTSKQDIKNFDLESSEVVSKENDHVLIESQMLIDEVVKDKTEQNNEETKEDNQSVLEPLVTPESAINITVIHDDQVNLTQNDDMAKNIVEEIPMTSSLSEPTTRKSDLDGSLPTKQKEKAVEDEQFRGNIDSHDNEADAVITRNSEDDRNNSEEQSRDHDQASSRDENSVNGTDFANSMEDQFPTIQNRLSEFARRLKVLQWHASRQAEIELVLEKELRECAQQLSNELPHLRALYLSREINRQKSDVSVKALDSSIPSNEIFLSPLGELSRRIYDTLEYESSMSADISSRASKASTQIRTSKRTLKSFVKTNQMSKEEMDAKLKKAQIEYEELTKSLDHIMELKKSCEEEFEKVTKSGGASGKVKSDLREQTAKFKNEYERLKKKTEEAQKQLEGYEERNDDRLSNLLRKSEEELISRINSAKKFLGDFVSQDESRIRLLQASPIGLPLPKSLTPEGSVHASTSLFDNLDVEMEHPSLISDASRFFEHKKSSEGASIFLLAPLSRTLSTVDNENDLRSQIETADDRSTSIGRRPIAASISTSSNAISNRFKNVFSIGKRFVSKASSMRNSASTTRNEQQGIANSLSTTGNALGNAGGVDIFDPDENERIQNETKYFLLKGVLISPSHQPITYASIVTRLKSDRKICKKLLAVLPKIQKALRSYLLHYYKLIYEYPILLLSGEPISMLDLNAVEGTNQNASASESDATSSDESKKPALTISSSSKGKGLISSLSSPRNAKASSSSNDHTNQLHASQQFEGSTRKMLSLSGKTKSGALPNVVKFSDVITAEALLPDHKTGEKRTLLRASRVLVPCRLSQIDSLYNYTNLSYESMLNGLTLLLRSIDNALKSLYDIEMRALANDAEWTKKANRATARFKTSQVNLNKHIRETESGTTSPKVVLESILSRESTEEVKARRTQALNRRYVAASAVMKTATEIAEEQKKDYERAAARAIKLFHEATQFQVKFLADMLSQNNNWRTRLYSQLSQATNASSNVVERIDPEVDVIEFIRVSLTEKDKKKSSQAHGSLTQGNVAGSSINQYATAQSFENNDSQYNMQETSTSKKVLTRDGSDHTIE